MCGCKNEGNAPPAGFENSGMSHADFGKMAKSAVGCHFLPSDAHESKLVNIHTPKNTFDSAGTGQNNTNSKKTLHFTSQYAHSDGQTHTHTQANTSTDRHEYTHTHTRTHMHTHSHTHKHTHTQSYTHTHTHAPTRECDLVVRVA